MAPKRGKVPKTSVISDLKTVSFIVKKRKKQQQGNPTG